MFVPKMLNTKGLSYALKLLHAFWHFSFLPETFSKSELKSYVTELLFENLEKKTLNVTVKNISLLKNIMI